MTQTARILEHLRSHPGGLTALEAVNLGMGLRLAARIADIKTGGDLRPTERIAVQTEPHDGGTHARYVLVTDRMFSTMDEWTAFQQSEHKRHGHAPSVKAVPGCVWCRRWAAMDAVFRGGEVAAMEDATDTDAAWAGSLWGDAA